MLVFDLDPDEGISWDELKYATVELREFLKQIGLESFVRTSGGKGLHVVVPVTPTQEWDDAKAFCKAGYPVNAILDFRDFCPDVFVSENLPADFGHGALSGAEVDK